MEAEAEEDAAYDEHVWLSLRNAETLVTAIAEALCTADAAHSDAYRANAEGYNAALSALDAQYAEAVAAGAHDTILVPDRFPFRYLTDDYDLNYYAAFAGCSAETEASFETLVFLSEKLDALGLPAVIVTESSDRKLAETVIRQGETKAADILVLDSMQSVTQEDIGSGTTYLGIMEQNLNVLKQALA
jgi:zinc transport system substrate-binding protein